MSKALQMTILSKNIDNRTPEEKQQNMDNLFDTLIKALQ